VFGRARSRRDSRGSVGAEIVIESRFFTEARRRRRTARQREEGDPSAPAKNEDVTIVSA